MTSSPEAGGDAPAHRPPHGGDEAGNGPAARADPGDRARTGRAGAAAPAKAPADAGRRRHRGGVLRTAVVVLLAAVLLCAGVVLAARACGWQSGPLLFLVALTPYVGIGCALAAVVAAVIRARVLVFVGAVLAAVVVWSWLPAFVADPRSGSPLDLRVMTLNLRLGQADATAVVDGVRRERVDLLALEEITPDSLARLGRAGLDEALPHRVVRTGPGATGTGIWSRYPLRRAFDTDGLGFENVGANITAPSGDLVFLGVHPVAPRPLSGSAADKTLFPLLTLIEELAGPAIVAGDLNATRDNLALRRLESAGYVDAADAAGAGLVPTWPNDLRPVPPIVGIDHVLSRGRPVARSVRTFEVPGSDHLAVVAEF